MGQAMGRVMAGFEIDTDWIKMSGWPCILYEEAGQHLPLLSVCAETQPPATLSQHLCDA